MATSKYSGERGVQISVGAEIEAYNNQVAAVSWQFYYILAQ